MAWRVRTRQNEGAARPNTPAVCYNGMQMRLMTFLRSLPQASIPAHGREV